MLKLRQIDSISVDRKLEIVKRVRSPCTSLCTLCRDVNRCALFGLLTSLETLFVQLIFQFEAQSRSFVFTGPAQKKGDSSSEKAFLKFCSLPAMQSSECFGVAVRQNDCQIAMRCLPSSRSAKRLHNLSASTSAFEYSRLPNGRERTIQNFGCWRRYRQLWKMRRRITGPK